MMRIFLVIAFAMLGAFINAFAQATPPQTLIANVHTPGNLPHDLPMP